jgi:hypothetical protein
MVLSLALQEVYQVYEIFIEIVRRVAMQPQTHHYSYIFVMYTTIL